MTSVYISGIRAGICLIGLKNGGLHQIMKSAHIMFIFKVVFPSYVLVGLPKSHSNNIWYRPRPRPTVREEPESMIALSIPLSV